MLKIFVELYIIEKIKKLGVYNYMDTRQKGLLSQIKHHALAFLISVRDYLKESFNIDIRNYGVIGAAAVLLVIAKIIVFYVLMGTSSHFVSVCVITLLFIYLLFKAFNNKWVPATIFFVLSVLMFCDVTYSSFFNRYLSVGMIGAAEVVGDIGESIKEVLRPINFFMLVDAAFIIFMLALKKKSGGRSGRIDSDNAAGAVLDGEDTEDKNAKKEAEKAHSKKKAKINLKAIAFFVIMVLFTTTNIFNWSYITSLSNQEFFSYHIKDIVSGAFAGETSENLAAWTDSYEQEKNGPLFGAAKDKNLIMIQVESMQDFVIGREYEGQELTPNLNALIEGNATYFDNFYQQVGSGNTSDAEFAANNSLYGTLVSYTYKLFNQNYFRGLPVLLGEMGYDTAVFHAHEDRSFWSRESMYPSEGFNRYYGGLKGRGGDYEMTEWMGWGLTDSEFYPQTVEYMKELAEPFYSFVISISNHHPYEMLDHYKFIELAPEDEDTIVGKYLQSAAYTDYALGVFFDELKEAGLYDNSIFVIYGDHTGLAHSDEIDESMERILGKPYDYEEMLKVPLIIYSPDESIELGDTIMTAGGETDIMPTVAYLMGIEELDTIYTGHNLYTVKEGFVAEQTYMTKGSFFTNDIAYEMSRDGVFENGRAWNIHTGEAVDVSLCYDGYLRSVDIVNTSEYVLKSDAIRMIFKDGESIGNVDSINISRIYADEIVYAGYPDSELVGTNSAEALDYSVYAGNRSIRLDVYWNEDSQPYTINQKTGEVEMEYDEIIEWMESHASVDLYMNMEKSADFMIQFCGTLSPATRERIILEVPNAEEYTGRYEAILDLNSAGLSYENALEFIKSNKVWAVVMSKEDSEGRFAKLLGGDVTVYINDKDAGIITKVN